MDHISFNQSRACTRLRELAASPFDLTAPGSLNGERLRRYRLCSCGYDLLYATQRVDDETLDQLQLLADECAVMEQFLAMKSGAVMNRIEGWESEERRVLHTACRDLFSDSPACAGAVADAARQLEKLKIFLDEIDSGKITNHRGEPFSTIVQVGIGGSDLGPRALYLALERYAIRGRRAEFISNVDPDDAAGVLSRLDLSTTLFNIVSKSGTTLETRTNEELVRQSLKAAGLDAAGHMIAVTGAGSPMDGAAGYLSAFHMYDYIGGRYSATSMVGAVTLGFTLGYDNFLELLRGAHEMDRAAEEPDIRRNIPLMLALLGIWNHNFLGGATVAVLPYSQALSRFPAHLQQCDMESNGKSITRKGGEVSWKTGPVLWGEPGTNGQHAFYQLIHQGTEWIPVEFIGFRRSQYERDIVVDKTTSQQKLVANMLAQSLALARGRKHENPNKRFAGNRPSTILIGDRLTPFSMGALLALYEAKIVFQGFLWDINSFDQEGVQLGKILAGRLLDQLTMRDGIEKRNDAENDTEHDLLRAARML